MEHFWSFEGPNPGVAPVNPRVKVSLVSDNRTGRAGIARTFVISRSVCTDKDKSSVGTHSGNFNSNRKLRPELRNAVGCSGWVSEITSLDVAAG